MTTSSHFLFLYLAALQDKFVDPSPKVYEVVRTSQHDPNPAETSGFPSCINFGAGW